MKMTAERALATIEKYNANYLEWNALEIEAHSMANKLKEANHEWCIAKFPTRNWGTVKKEDFRTLITDGDYLTVHTEYYSCGETEYSEWTFPVQWFDNPDWKTEYFAQKDKTYEEGVQAAKEKEEIAEKKAKADGLVRRRKQWEELKAEFGNE